MGAEGTSVGMRGLPGWFCKALVLCFGITSVLESAQGREDRLRVMSWNVRNYLVMDRRTVDGYRPEYPKPEVEKAALRSVVLEERPDLLLLQEMGRPEELRELQRDLSRAGLDYPFGGVAENADPVRRLAFLATDAPSEVIAVAELDFAYLGGRERVKRGIQGVRMEVGGEDLWIYNLHLKSRFTDRDDDPESSLRRAREAEAIRDFLLERHGEGRDGADTSWIVLGDFNDHPRSPAVGRFLSIGGRAIGDLVNLEDSRGERWTHRYRREDAYTRVDLAIVGRRAEARFRISGWLNDKPDALRASDHRPLILEVVRKPE